MTSHPKSPGALFDIHTHAEFVTRDIDATMATMSDRPHITNVPTMTGGLGREAVRHFYDSWFVGHLPDDWTVELLSRTESKDQVVDEVIASFTHDCPMECFLPGVPPTGRKVIIPLVVVVGVKDGKVAHEHILSTSIGTRPRCSCRSDCSTSRACRLPARSRPPACSTRAFRPIR